MCSSFLSCLVPPRFLWYSPVEASLSFPEGSPLNFSCHAHAVPPVNITWIYRNRHKHFKVLHEGESLLIDALEWSDSGSYECVASNGYHGSISRSFYVTVQCEWKENLLVRRERERENWASLDSPRLQISESRMSVEIGQTVLIKCDVCSNPAVREIHWLRAERVLSDVNVLFKSELLPRDRQDDQQCSQSIMEIVVREEHTSLFTLFSLRRISVNINWVLINVGQKMSWERSPWSSLWSQVSGRGRDLHLPVRSLPVFE